MSNKAIPEYGIIEWADASVVSGKPKIKKLKKETVTVRSVGKLFLSNDGILLVLHEFRPKEPYQRDVEATVIPMGWVQQIIPLNEATSVPLAPRKETSATSADPGTPQEQK